MSRRRAGTFADRYGPWALVAGASAGIGAAFATALAERGLNLVLGARRPQPLADLAARLPVRTVPVPADLSTVDGLEAAVAAACAGAAGPDGPGLVVCNAAYAPAGPFLELTEAHLTRALDTNCRAVLLLAHRYLPAMAARGRAG